MGLRKDHWLLDKGPPWDSFVSVAQLSYRNNTNVRKEIEILMKTYPKSKIKKIKPGKSGLNETKLMADWGWAGGAGHGNWF